MSKMLVLTAFLAAAVVSSQAVNVVPDLNPAASQSTTPTTVSMASTRTTSVVTPTSPTSSTQESSRSSWKESRLKEIVSTPVPILKVTTDWIFDLGPVVNGQYQYSLVTDGEKARQLFVLARDPAEFEALYATNVLRYVARAGFTGPYRKPYAIPHPAECVYPPCIMAEKQEAGKVSDSLQNLTCPLCLDIFDDPTLLTSCRHTFCRKCLKRYDLSHQDLDHMVCPLCRKITKLTANRVDDLDTDVTVNDIVDDYHVRCGGANAILEKRQLCNACSLQDVAVSFCKTCNKYMCEKCGHYHEHLTGIFEGHEIISIQDIMEGKVNIGRYPEKCSTHKQENKDMFCEDCKVHVCFKCVIIGHRDHKIKSHEDFEKELQVKVHDLIQRCTTKKSELEKNIQNVEVQRHEVHTAVQKLRSDVSQAYRTKSKQLEENQRILIDQIDALERSFDDDLNSLKSNNRQRIKSIYSSMTLVANDRLGRLEMDSLSAHTLLCEELDGMLKEATDRSSAAAITEKAQKKRFQHADDTRLDLGNISEPDPILEVIQCVNLRGEMFGMTKYSDSSVGIGYYNKHGIDIIHSNGTEQQYANVSSNDMFYDLVFQRDRTICIAKSSRNEAHLFDPNGTLKSVIRFANSSGYSLRLNRSPSDEIVIANNTEHVYIYDPTGSTLKHTIPTKTSENQASATTAGLIITSSCFNNPSIVTVYDRDGNAGKPLQDQSNVLLYAAVDEHDRVYVASVDSRPKSGKVVIRLYDIDGLNLKEKVQFNPLNLTLGSDWCYLVSLSPGMLAFACNNKLYFIRVIM